MRTISVGLIGDFHSEYPAHQAIPAALALSAEALSCAINPVWLPTISLEKNLLEKNSGAVLGSYDGLWCVPASPYESMEGALQAIQFAREQSKPFLGTCGGFQHALIEIARNVLGIEGADHAESDPEAAIPFITPLNCPLVEVSGRIRFAERSRLAEIYNCAEAMEPYHCRYGLNPDYRGILGSSPLKISAVDDWGEIRAVELEGHPFFFATLYQPERAALKGQIHPLVTAFLRSCLGGAPESVVTGSAAIPGSGPVRH